MQSNALNGIVIFRVRNVWEHLGVLGSLGLEVNQVEVRAGSNGICRDREVPQAELTSRK